MRFPRLCAAASLKHARVPYYLEETVQYRFPRLCAAASLKRLSASVNRAVSSSSRRFPRLCAAASLKHSKKAFPKRSVRTSISAALCRGLIEAVTNPQSCAWRMLSVGFPRLCAAASLKPHAPRHVRDREGRFPRLCAAASLKLGVKGSGFGEEIRFPRLCAAASLKPRAFARFLASPWPARFPRLCAAASLKPPTIFDGLCPSAVRPISAALCRGLIEARSTWTQDLASPGPRFPRLCAAASLKLRARIGYMERVSRVRVDFRGFVPRPH